MLAELIRVPLATIRRWYRRGLLVPAKEVRRLPYFDFQEVATAKQLAQLIAAGATPASVEREVAALSQRMPDVSRPLRQLSVVVRGRQILLRQADGLVDTRGQRQFDFETLERDSELEPTREMVYEVPPSASTTELAGPLDLTPEGLLRAAADWEAQGDLRQATELVRASLAASGPRADTCFQLAELLYRQGDLAGARERYYVTIELDEEFVEARCSLGCVLAESGDLELAVAAFQGALVCHPHYADVHYHLARILSELGRPVEAQPHWSRFLELAPESPWAEEAASRLTQES